VRKHHPKTLGLIFLILTNHYYMTNKIFIFLILFVLAASGKAQTIKGSVMDANNRQPLPGATVHWLNTATGTATDKLGVFEIGYPVKSPAYLVVSYIGYLNDTIPFKNQTELHIVLKQSLLLKEIQVTETKEAVTFSTIDPINKQSLGTRELQKAACCNLVESFETNTTVDVSYSDALTGSKQIKMLGLDGSYTQILSESQPSIRGLSTNYGMAHIPGTWIESIDITKGIGSVVNGYESMAGQINIELHKPEKAERLFVNLYAGDWGRYEANLHASHKFNKKWSTLLLTHASTIANKNDFNKDGYIDMATGQQYSFMNKWKYETPGKLMATFGVFANMDDRKGGQIAYRSNEDNIAKRHYGVEVKTQHIEGFGKAAIGFAGKPYRSLALMTNARTYRHDAVFGPKTYTGNEQSSHSNLIYQTIINTSEHKIKTGFSYMLDQYQEVYNDSAFSRVESVPGAFAEYHYENLNKISVLTGLRVDYHNLFGALVNPRLHVKYNFTKSSVFRISAGRGMRVANVFIENAAVMASGRKVIVQDRFTPEIAWNYGVSFTHKFKIANKNATFITDFFYTDFENQVVVDLDKSAVELHFYNLNGKSYSQTFQAEFIYEPVKRFEIRTAYKWQDVKTTYHGNLMERPLVSRNRVLLNLAYATRFEKWKFDVTAKWFDKSRIATTHTAGAAHTSMNAHSNYSPDYEVYNAQITRKFKKFELYVGVENILDYMQHHQIVNPQDPFAAHFDASQIWGPVMGRIGYIGFRMSIK